MDVVSALRAALIEKVGRPRFDRWLANDTRLDLVDGQLVITVPSSFYEGWLRRNFHTHLDAACRGVLGRSVALVFRIEPSTNEPVAATEAAKREAPGGDGTATKQPAVLPLKQAASAAGARSRRRFQSLKTLVTGETNRLAVTSAHMACAQPGKLSPLFIHGPTGVGKTHLLEGVWSELRRSRLQMRCVFLTAEQFTSYFLAALRGGGLPSFRRKYRGVELLVIDDLQFFAGKRATLVELLYTINTLLEEGRQLVLSADRPLGELHALGPELIARLQSGMACRMDPPDFEVRLGILRRLAKLSGEAFTDEVLRFVASRLTTHAWELSGAIHRLAATRQAINRSISLAMAEEALHDIIQQQQRVVRLADVEKAVCDVLGLEASTLQSRQKARHASYPRMLAMWLARKHTRAALTEIGQYFGRRSHATVIAAQKKVTRWIDGREALRLADRDWNVEDAIRRVEEHLRTG